MPLLIVLIGVIILIFMIVKLKMNTFVGLVITSFIVGLLLGLPLTKIPQTIETGIGGQLGHLAIIFGFGSMLGKLVSDAGGYRIATALINKFGRRWIQVTVTLASFIIGLALFFEVGLVVVLPIIFIIARELDMPLMYLGIPMAATLNVTHAFLPPHPAPTAITDILGANLGHVLLLGILAAIPTIIIAGPVYNWVLQKVYPRVYRKNIDISVLGEYKEFKLEETPKFGISVLTAMMPVILIAVATICSFIFPKNNPVNEFIQFIGAPDLAMLLLLIFAIFTMGLQRNQKMEDISTSLADSIKQISVMLLIIGGGGAFKQVLVDGGISKYISGLFAQTSISPILAAWLITALLRMSLGSSTVAAMTAAGLVVPMAHQFGSNSIMATLIVLSIGAGSVFCGHVNDAGFWMIKEYFGLSLKETLLSWTTLTSVLALAGLGAVYAISLFV
ncbi:gluconate permease [Limosilactobacillus reuteri]|uniref:gluconate:H+ symporter n=1 Tax=Limosilactobacillus reuteri TaxID=1598 RepID=UPI000B983DFB|nr:gluconate:H+ symporter [Limosilactobacillus reuteri]OYS45360.1 gluconate permease [Limosilactobacillus reuteri]OYS47507.1 gluconate permease [Limosilactobacillus reuteri]OYS53020.1 gluconate permease [Limosilactobacillus reuteri]OYS53492.1 gluconate permease [Limosilactobacillus reuteri]OYS66795.1 gluconate permease [Limosilactobacillus reuteri]